MMISLRQTNMHTTLSGLIFILPVVLVGIVVTILKPSVFSYGAAAALALTILALCLKAPRLMLVLFVFYTLFQDLTLYFTGAGFDLSSSVDLLDELVLVGLTLSWLLQIAVNKKPFKRTPVDGPILIFAAFYVSSVLWNDVAPLNALLGFRDTVVYVLLFYALTQLDFGSEFLRWIIEKLFLVAYLQLAVLLLQWATWYFETGSFFLEDAGVGLMGPRGAHKLGYFAGMLLMAYLGFFREGIYRRKSLVITLILIVVISSARAVIFYVPLALTLLFWRDFMGRRVAVYWIGALLSVLVVTLAYLSLPGTDEATLDPRRIYRQQLRGELTMQDGVTVRYTRIRFLRYTRRVLRDNKALLLGLGPGWYASKTASRLGSPHFDALPPPAQPTVSQLAITLGEYGLIGTLLLIYIYWRLFRYVWRLKSVSTHRYLRGACYATAGSLAFCALSVLSVNLFEVQQVFIIPWLLAGTVVVNAARNAGSRGSTVATRGGVI